jgi:hypothetical protein
MIALTGKTRKNYFNSCCKNKKQIQNEEFIVRQEFFIENILNSIQTIQLKKLTVNFDFLLIKFTNFGYN